MSKIITLFLALLLLFSAQGVLAQGPFQEKPLGDPLGAGTFVIYNDLAVGADNMPVAAWSDGTTISAARWDGSAWQPLGETVTSNGEMFSKLAVGDDGTVVITYLATTADGSNAELRASLFDGTAWTPLGDVINLYQSGTFNFDEAVTITSEGPVIAWREAQEFMQPNQLYARRWDGSAWSEAESISDPAAEAGVSAAAALPNGGFVVAFDQSGTTVTRLWDGAMWQNLPDMPGEEADVSFLRLAGTADGGVILYRYYYDTLQSLSQWTPGDTGWTELGDVSTVSGVDPSGSIDAADLLVGDDGTVWLAWSYGGDGAAGLDQWDGSAWTAVDGGSFTFAEQPTGFKAPVAVGPDGSLYLARSNSSFALQVSQYTGG